MRRTGFEDVRSEETWPKMSSPSRLIIWSEVSVVFDSGRTLLEATTCAAIAFREERGCWEPSLVAGEGWGEIGMRITLGVVPDFIIV